MLFPSPELEELLGRIFDSVREEDLKTERDAGYEQRRHDFIFHMTDWLKDLQELNELYGQPEKAEAGKASITLIGILIHVIPHLNAAGRLLLDEISDPFAVGAVKTKAGIG